MYTEGLKVPVGANQFLGLAEPSETSTGHLTGSRPVVADGEGLMTQYKEGGVSFCYGTSWWSLGDGWQGYGTLAIVVHDVIQVFILQVHFLGATDLAQLRGPLSESLWVGPAVVAVHLGVSRVVLAGRSRLSWGAARGDKFWDTWSSVHFGSGRTRFSWLATRCRQSSSVVVEWKQWLLTSATAYNSQCMDQRRQRV